MKLVGVVAIYALCIDATVVLARYILVHMLVIVRNLKKIYLKSQW